MNDESRTVRATTDGDRDALAGLYAAAFPDEPLWPLAARLINDVPGVVSLTATIDARPIGHALLSPCGVDGPSGSTARVGLFGPLAVAPRAQRRGIGSALVWAALDRARRDGLARMLVLGDPRYYCRFGFEPETTIRPPYRLPADWTDAWRGHDLGTGTPPLVGALRPPAPWWDPRLWAP